MIFETKKYIVNVPIVEIIILLITIISVIMIIVGEDPPLTETGLRIHKFEILKPIGFCILIPTMFLGTAYIFANGINSIFNNKKD